TIRIGFAGQVWARALEEGPARPARTNPAAISERCIFFSPNAVGETSTPARPNPLLMGWAKPSSFAPFARKPAFFSRGHAVYACYKPRRPAYPLGVALGGRGGTGRRAGFRFP